MRLTLLIISTTLLLACPEPEKQGPAPKRFAAVKQNKRAARAAKVFCEKIYPAGAKAWKTPPEQPLPTAIARPTPLLSGWRWINFWASWCKPCLEEMPLLERWRKTLAKDGVPLAFELWSIDEERSEFESALARRDRLPEGDIRWLRSGDDLAGVLASLGVERDSAIPIHALVDPDGNLRCVRVGSVGANDYGTIKSIIQ